MPASATSRRATGPKTRLRRRHPGAGPDGPLDPFVGGAQPHRRRAPTGARGRRRRWCSGPSSPPRGGARAASTSSISGLPTSPCSHDAPRWTGPPSERSTREPSARLRPRLEHDHRAAGPAAGPGRRPGRPGRRRPRPPARRQTATAVGQDLATASAAARSPLHHGPVHGPRVGRPRRLPGQVQAGRHRPGQQVTVGRFAPGRR